MARETSFFKGWDPSAFGLLQESRCQISGLLQFPWIDNQIYQQVRWVKLEELTDYKFLAADRGLIKDLAAGKLL